MNVIKALFFRELKTRFGQNQLGYAWVLGEPMLHVLIFVFIFSLIKDKISSDVSIEMFLVLGMIPFFMFRNIVKQLISGIGANKALFAYPPVQPMHVYITRSLLEIGIYLTVFCIFIFVFGWFFGFNVIPSDFLSFIASLLVLIVFSIALGICLSILVHAIDLIGIVINIVLTALYFISGIIYPLSIVPAQYHHFFIYNPIVHLIEPIRKSYYETYPMIEGITILYPLALSIIFLFIGLWFYYYRREALGSSV
jgi:capsular polysaccharide transport system permease protein